MTNILWTYDDRLDQASRNAQLRPITVEDLQISRAPRWKGEALRRAVTEHRLITEISCPAVQALSTYGYIVTSPGDILIQRSESYSRWRQFNEHSASFCDATVGGDKCDLTESGFYASWLTSTNYAKIFTGIQVLFPTSHMLYQGPIPSFQGSLPFTWLPIASGIEFGTGGRNEVIDGEIYCRSQLNVIVHLPTEQADTIRIKKGEPIGWIHLVPKKTRAKLI